MSELNQKVTVPADLIGKLFQKGLASIIKDCTVSVMEEAKCINDKPKGEKPTERPEEPRVMRKLIKFICPECGEFNWTMVEKTDKTYKMTCRGCRQDFEFYEMDLVKAEYRCTSCDRSNYFYTPYIEGMEVKTDECKCGHKTAMTFDHNSGLFVEGRNYGTAES
jgi:ribosomal protein L33